MIKKLAGCIREYKAAAILTPITVTFEVILEVIIPMLMAVLIDRGINRGSLPRHTENRSAACGMLRGVAPLRSAVGRILRLKAGAGFAKNLRHDMFYRVQDYSFANIDKFSASSIITRMTTDVTNVQNAFQMIIRIAVRCPAMLIFALVMAFSVNAELALVFLVTTPILGIGLFIMMKSAFPVFNRVFKKYDNLNRIVQENLRGIRVVKAFVREDYETAKFKDASEDIYREFTLAERILAFNGPLMQLAVYGSILLISWFGASLIIKGQGARAR